MRFLKGILFCGLLLWVSTVKAQGHFELTADMQEAYRFAISLQNDKAKQKIGEIKRNDPDNLLVYHIENYVDFFEVFINEDKERFEELEKNRERRLEKIKSGDEESPYYRFCQAEVKLQWALARSKFNQNFTAAKEALSAYHLLKENVIKHPDFIYNYKSLSIIHVLAKSIPGIVRLIFGVKGSIEQGTSEIRELYDFSRQNQDLFHHETTIIFAYILFYQNNQKEEAWELLEANYVGKETNNPLISFVVANMAQQTGRNDLAIKILKDRPAGGDYMDFHYLDFLLGKFKLYRLDEDAHVYMEKFLAEFNGRHYLKEAYQKLAWYHLVIREDLAGYKKYMKRLQNRGDDLIDEDKQALRESRSKEIPHPDLLKARLLYDGAYYDKAYNLLIKRSFVYTDPLQKLEYNYRMGRITQALKNYPDAIQYYIETISSKYKDYYYPCNAALQVALILEEQGRYKQALEYADKCLDFSPDQYETSLHQKAKSAKQRIREKWGQ